MYVCVCVCVCVCIYVCVMLKNRSNKRPTQEQVGRLAHSVWDVNYLYVFYSGDGVESCFVFHF